MREEQTPSQALENSTRLQLAFVIHIDHMGELKSRLLTVSWPTLAPRAQNRFHLLKISSSFGSKETRLESWRMLLGVAGIELLGRDVVRFIQLSRRLGTDRV